MVMDRKRLFAAVEAFLMDYTAFPDPTWAAILALWAIGTWIYQSFDAYPYLVITSATKRSGKTRTAELLSFVSMNAKNFAAMTPATMFHMLRDTPDGVTVFTDEAETLSSEAANTMRAVLNVGYRRGQTIPRLVKNEVVEFPVYCPKCFVLIGDVYDTLRDRSIVIELVRGVPRKRFEFETARNTAQSLTESLKVWRETPDAKAIELPDLSFFTGREAEIWAPIFALARLFCPDRTYDVTRAAVDLAADKTADKRRYVELEARAAELDEEDFAMLALRDLDHAIGSDARLFSDEAIVKMHDITTAPWRKFRGRGLDAIALANLVSRFGLRTCSIKLRGKVQRGYKREDIKRAMARLSGGAVVSKHSK